MLETNEEERKWSKMARYPAMAAQDVAEMGGGGIRVALGERGNL